MVLILRLCGLRLPLLLLPLVLSFVGRSDHISAVDLNKLPRASEYVLRAQAVRSLRPEYPRASQRLGHQGLAVAIVVLTRSGVPVTVRILQTPDDAIADSMVHTLMKWRFNTRGAPVEYCGKLTYYFRLTPSGSRVTAGDETE